MPSDHFTATPAARQDFTIYRRGEGTHIEFDPPADPAVVNAALRINRIINRQIRRMCRESHLRNAPGWIDADPPAFVFPWWGPAWRPFDWAVD